MAIKIFTTPRLSTDLPEEKVTQLIIEFRTYIETGRYRPHFGRDYLFERPASAVEAELWHMHVHPNFIAGTPVTNQTNLLKTWRLHSKNQRDMASDTWLIYCQGLHDADNFLLLAFWKDNAHLRANKTTLVGMLADEANKFRKTY